MFRCAQFATGRIRRGGHDSVSYDVLSARHYRRTRKHLVRNVKSRGLFSDADKNNGNRARTRRRQRATTSRARWRRDLAAYVPGTTASQLSTVFLGATGLAHWDMDAANRDELVRLSNYEFKAAPGDRRRHGIRSDDVVLDLGRVARRSSSKTLDPPRDPDGTNGLRVLSCSRCLGGFRQAVVHYRYRCIERRRHGLRYASAPGVHSRNDKP